MHRRIPNLSRVFQAGAYGRPNASGFDWLTLSPFVLVKPSPSTAFTDDGVTQAAATQQIKRLTNSGSLGQYWSQATGAYRPTLQLVNGVYVVRGNGSQYFSDAQVDTTGLTGAVLALLAKKTTSNDDTGLHYFGAGNVSWHNFAANGNLYDSFGSTVRKSPGAGPDWTAWTSLVIKSTSSEWTVFYDGSQVYTTGSNTVGFGATTEILSNGGGNFATADIALLGLFPDSVNMTTLHTQMAALAADAAS